MGWENGTGVQKIQAREDSPEVGKKADLRFGWMWTTDEGLRQGKETEMLGCPKGWICGCHEATPWLCKEITLTPLFCLLHRPGRAQSSHTVL